MRKIFIGLLVLALITIALIPIGQLNLITDNGNELNLPRIELGGKSLNEVFGDNAVKLADYQLLYESDFENDSASYLITDATYTITDGFIKLTNTASGGRIQLNYLWSSGGTYYTNAKIKGSSNNSIYLETFSDIESNFYNKVGEFDILSSYGNNGVTYGVKVINNAPIGSTMEIDYLYLFDVYDIMGLFPERLFSPFYEKYFDELTNLQRQTQFDLWVEEGVNQLNPYLCYRKAGIYNLNKNQFEYYYNLYLSLS